MAKPIVEMLVESVTLELPDTKTVKLRWPEGYDIEFKTGQFVTVCWPDEPQYKRAYSLSSCALDRGFYDITVKRDGKMGTRIVDWAREGHIVGVLAPTGRFTPVFEPDDKHLICIAGGSGITPFRGFVREATRRKLNTRITVLYSVRTPREIIFHDEFRQLEKENPNFKFEVTCTRLEADACWSGRRGRINASCVQEYVRDLGQTIFYICGPNALVETTETMLQRELNAQKQQTRTEKWG
jgi:ferredoxin-NADP reductase